VTKKAANYLEKIIAFVKAEQWRLNSYEIADWLWLWQIQCDRSGEIQSEESPAQTPATEKGNKKLENEPKAGEQDNSQHQVPTFPVTLPEPPPGQEKQGTTQRGQQYADDRDLPISVPDTAMLREALRLNRAAKPIIRKVPSVTAIQLDIAKTVQETAEISLGRSQLTIIPVYKPARVRALDAILLVETHRSMLLWRRLQEELWEWLTRLGAFRDVRIAGLSYQQGEVRISPALDKSQSATLAPESLLAPRGERVIFVFSDGTSPAWYAGAYNSVLRQWGSQQIVCLLSPFPESLWSHTALGKGIGVSFHSLQPRRPSQQWQIAPTDLPIELEFRFEEEKDRQQYLKDCLRLPVLNLTPYGLAAWAGAIDGDPDCRCAGFLLDVPKSPPKTGNFTPDEAIAEEAVERSLQIFRRTASPNAWQLMRRLSAVPVNLAVMRLIQRELLPGSSPTDLAEVLFSGLLPPRQNYDFYTPPDRLRFELLEPARQLLRENLDFTGKLELVNALSEFIAKKFGLTFQQFEARLLTDPRSLVGKDGQLVEAFARITADLFEQSGLTEIAERLRESQQLLQEATRAREEQEFLTRFREEVTTVQVGKLTILEGESEAQFLDLREQLTGLNLADGELYELQQQALESGIAAEDLDAQKIFICDRLVADSLNLSTWKGETVFVDRGGEIIERQPVTAQYYEHTLPRTESQVDRPPRELTTLKMLLIPAGILLKEGKRIFIKPFFMSQTPITQAQWWAIATRTDLKVQNDLNPTPSEFKQNYRKTSHWLCPVERVSWYDAIEFCARLAKLAEMAYKLPTEDQWEYACHGLRQPPESGEYAPFHYGETLTGKLANYDSSVIFAEESKMNSPAQTTPVGSYPNAFGLKDLHGNVWEWSIDLWDSEENPNNNEARNLDKTRVIRGGSWNNNPGFCCSVYRNKLDPNKKGYDFGFRVVCGLFLA
jgi:hypothetical protein